MISLLLFSFLYSCVPSIVFFLYLFIISSRFLFPIDRARITTLLVSWRRNDKFADLDHQKSPRPVIGLLSRFVRVMIRDFNLFMFAWRLAIVDISHRCLTSTICQCLTSHRKGLPTYIKYMHPAQVLYPFVGGPRSVYVRARAYISSEVDVLE